MNSSRVKYYINRGGFFAESAVILLVLAATFRVIGCWGYWNDRVNFLMLLALPAFCCVLLALCILLFGKKGFFLSFIPVLLGVVFFVFKSLSFASWLHTVLCILLYMLVAVIYTATVFGWIGTKWLLPPLFALPFVYHIVFEDLPALNNTAVPVTFAAGMQEMSVLCIMAALFCVGMGLKKRPEEPKSVEAEVVEPVVDGEHGPKNEIPEDAKEVSVPEPETVPVPEQEPTFIPEQTTEQAPVSDPPQESAPAQEPVPAQETATRETPARGFRFFRSSSKKTADSAAPAAPAEPAEPAETAEPAEAAAPAEAAQTSAAFTPVESEDAPFFSDQPYEPVLTLDPEPWEPEELNGPESEHEQ